MRYFIAIIFVLAFAVGCGKQPQQPESTPDSVAAGSVSAAVVEPELHTVSAEMFHRFFDENEVRALRVFGDKPAAFFAKVKRISARKNGPEVQLDCGDFDAITCEFTPEYSGDVETLKVGAMATIIGVPYRGTFGPNLSQCCLPRPGEEFPPGGFKEFREFEVAHYRTELENSLPLRDAAAGAVDRERNVTTKKIQQKKLDALDGILGSLRTLLRQAELDLEAAESKRVAS